MFQLLPSAYFDSLLGLSVSWLRLLHAVSSGEWISAPMKGTCCSRHTQLSSADMETYHLVHHFLLEVSGRLVDRRHSASTLQSSFNYWILFYNGIMKRNRKCWYTHSLNILRGTIISILRKYIKLYFTSTIKFLKNYILSIKQLILEEKNPCLKRFYNNTE